MRKSHAFRRAFTPTQRGHKVELAYDFMGRRCKGSRLDIRCFHLVGERDKSLEY